MTKRVALGKLATVHTVDANGRASSSATGYYKVSNAEAIRVGAYISIDGTNNIAGTNVRVTHKNQAAFGANWDIVLSHNKSSQYLPNNGTFYVDYDQYGLKVAKQNANVDQVGQKDLLFDSRSDRRGVVYAQGFQSSASTEVNFKRGDDFLNYIPLITHDEKKQGFRKVYSQTGAISIFANNAIAEQIASREDSIQPIRAASYTIGQGPWHEEGTGPGTQNVFRQSLNLCEDLSFKVLRLPCAYGYMNQLYYEDGAYYQHAYSPTKGKKRVISGKFTNSTAGFSNAGGMFVSRPGYNVDSCEIDDLLLGTDNGVAGVAYRGDDQKLATNYADVIGTSASIPTVSSTLTTTGSNETKSVSFYNPYAIAPTPQLASPTSVSYTSSSDNLFTTYSFTLESASTIKFSLEPRVHSLAIF